MAYVPLGPEWDLTVDTMLKNLMDRDDGPGGLKILNLADNVEGLPVPRPPVVVQQAVRVAAAAGHQEVELYDLAQAIVIQARAAQGTTNLGILTSAEEIIEANDLIDQIEQGIRFLRDVDDTPDRLKRFFDDFTFPDLKALRRSIGADDLTVDEIPEAKSEARSRLTGLARSVQLTSSWIADAGGRVMQADNAVQAVRRLAEIFSDKPPIE